jgi:hypothetical protein
MKDLLKLGIIYKDEKMVNHRSLLKVLFNPFLRMIGIQIVSAFNENGVLFKRIIMRCKIQLSFWNSWVYNGTNIRIIKKHIWY